MFFSEIYLWNYSSLGSKSVSCKIINLHLRFNQPVFDWTSTIKKALKEKEWIFHHTCKTVGERYVEIESQLLLMKLRQASPQPRFSFHCWRFVGQSNMFPWGCTLKDPTLRRRTQSSTFFVWEVKHGHSNLPEQHPSTVFRLSGDTNKKMITTFWLLFDTTNPAYCLANIWQSIDVNQNQESTATCLIALQYRLSQMVPQGLAKLHGMLSILFPDSSFLVFPFFELEDVSSFLGSEIIHLPNKTMIIKFYSLYPNIFGTSK